MSMELTLVGLPLGNIEDISLRAIKALKNASLIICEDTRVFQKLWQKLMNDGYIENKFLGEMRVINEFNEKEKVEGLFEEIKEKGRAVLVSDAGLPTISDPGYRLVNKVIESGGEIKIVPGPTAVMSSVAISGFSSDKVVFLGFLPKKEGKKKTDLEILKKLKEKGVTVVMYESPHRIDKTVKWLRDELGERTRAVLVRELTKKHEEVMRGSLKELEQRLGKKKIKGEVVLLIRL